MAKVISKRLYAHKQQNNIYEVCQTAYRPNYLAETALTKVHSDIMKAIDQGHCVFLVLLDLSAAFDMVSRDILLSCLRRSLGISESALDWISSYLTNRTQCVLINGKLTEPSAVKYGVLGHDFFSDYRAPVTELVRSFSLTPQCYANDTQIYGSFTPCLDEQDAIKNVEDCIECLRKFMQQNRLKFNDNRTEFLILGSPSNLKRTNTSSSTVGDQIIKASHNIRNIGAFFDENMEMETQVKNVCEKAWYYLHNIGKIRQYFSASAEQLNTVVHSYVTLHLDQNNVLLYELTPEISIRAANGPERSSSDDQWEK